MLNFGREKRERQYVPYLEYRQKLVSAVCSLLPGIRFENKPLPEMWGFLRYELLTVVQLWAKILLLLNIILFVGTTPRTRLTRVDSVR